MKKSTYLFAIALGVSSVTLAQNVGINTDGSDPDTDALLHLLNTNSTALDPLIRLENQQGSSVNGIELLNSGGATAAEWDLYIPSTTTDLRISNGTTDRITIQNDGDVGIGTTTPTVTLDVDGDAIFNESGAAKDFRIESDANTHQFYVDGTNNEIGVNTSTPASGLEINTSMGLKVTTITSAVPLDNTHNIVLCDTGPYTVTLPAAASNTGRVYSIKNIDSDCADITIDGNSTETIDGSETYVLDSYNNVVRIISDGSNWFIINENTVACPASIPGNATCTGANISATPCSSVSGATINDNGSTTLGTEYNWTGATTSGMANTSTTQAIVDIGGQCWMRYNMNIAPTAPCAATINTGCNTWLSTFPGDIGSWGYYNTATTNGTAGWATSTPGTNEGLLYQWSAAMNNSTTERAQGICPSGWHIPSDCEWMYLENTLGMSTTNQQATGWRTSGDVDYDLSSAVPSGTNNSGFTGLLAGSRSTNCSFYNRTSNGVWWSSSAPGATTASYRNLKTGFRGVGRGSLSKAHGFSVRCLKD